MDPERWRRIESIYHDALLCPEPEREGFVRQACTGDESLEREIRSILATPDAGSFLASLLREPDADRRHSSTIAPAFKTGATVSHYELLEKLGEGGMGVVFKARDKRLKRLVALKFIAFHAITDPASRSRLLQEARTASAFRHPNVAHVYDVDHATFEANAQPVTFIAMEYVPGKTLSEMLAESPLDLREVLRLALQASGALAAAHRAGVIHRDLKPRNIMVDENGVVKVLDFGLAKFIDVASEPDTPTGTTQFTTREGSRVGTVPYMSPEQVECSALDQRSDIFSFGAVLYEMVSGRKAFDGKSELSVLSAVLTATPVALQSIRPKVPGDLVRIVSRCLEKNPESRYSSGEELYQALLTCQTHMRARETGLRMILRRPRYIVPAAILIVVALIAGAFVLKWRSGVNWAKTQALPEISRLINQEKYSAAFALATRAGQYIPKDPTLAKLWDGMSSTISIQTTPAGAEVYRRDYDSKEDAWEYVGESPLNRIRIPATYSRWKFDKQGYDQAERTNEAILEKGNSGPVLSVELKRKGADPLGMVKVTSGNLPYTFSFPGYADLPEFRLDDFWIDKYEVTNQEYREFVRRGGYRKHEYWKTPFIRDGLSLDWNEAMSGFRDATGEPGPAGWVQGEYPAGEDNFPVSGVSWHEAAAYAEFAGKALPTIYHWALAADTYTSDSVIPASNFQRKGPARVGAFRGMSPFGSYDMAGNVKEWCWNEAASGKRYILGGGWNEPIYQFTEADARSPFDRDSNFGFRCVKYLSPPPKVLLDPLQRSARDYSREQPASEQVFQAYKGLYSYDKTPLQPVSESVTNKEYWRREKISFAAAYGNERVTAYLFLPKKSKPPFQTIVYFPGSWALNIHSSSELPADDTFAFIIKSGRALMYPIYKGTYERIDGLKSTWPNRTSLYRDHVIDWYKDLARSIDYLEMRPDIDHNKLGYFGISWGGILGAILPAIETRLQVCVLAFGGFAPRSTLPEVDQINFAPRVKQPVVMLNGRYDFFFPLETSQNPMFRLLGTPAHDKRHLIYETSHGIPSNALIQETLAWYDRYLGPVEAAP